MDADELLDLSHKAVKQQLEQTQLMLEKHFDFLDRAIMQQAALTAVRGDSEATEQPADPTR